MIVAKTKDGKILEKQTVEDIEVIQQNLINAGINLSDIEISIEEEPQ